MTWAFKNLVAFVTILFIIIVAVAVFFGIEAAFSSNQFPGLTLLSVLIAIFVGACTLLIGLVFFPPLKMIKAEFTDANGQSNVNAIIFFVDIAPRGVDIDGSLLPDEAIVAMMDKTKVAERITEQEDYIESIDSRSPL